MATATRVWTLNTEADNLTTLTTAEAAEVWAYIDFSWTICFSVVRGSVVELEAYIDWCGGTEMGLQWQIICITLRETSVIYSGYVILVINFICRSWIWKVLNIIRVTWSILYVTDYRKKPTKSCILVREVATSSNEIMN